MRVAMVTDYALDKEIIKGGIQGVTQTLVKSLIKYDNNIIIDVITPAKDNDIIYHNDNLTIHSLKIPMLPGFLTYWSIYKFKLHKYLYKLNPDITHFQGVAGWTINYNRPYVLTIHGIAEKDVLFSNKRFKYLRSNLLRIIENKGRKESKYIVSINEYIHNQLNKIISGECRKIENPVSDIFFSNSEKTSDRYNILFAGVLNALKNVTGLLYSFNKVLKVEPNAHLYIAGTSDDTKYISKCKSIVEELKIESSVEFLGGLDRKKILYYMNKSSCLVLPSLQENAPLIISESMSIGLPVIASNICGIPYMLDHGELGILIDPSNVEDIAGRIIELLNDRLLRENISKKSKIKALELYKSNVVAKKTYDYYKNILEETESIK